uniref:Uncharacterized protein n=1 Tax=Gasterosteus aculeatus TaxID=69293 RepID=G3QCF4_GASAC
MLKQALFSHISTEAEEETEGVHEAVVPERPPQGRASTSSHREDPRPPAGLAELPQTPEHNGGFVVLDFGGGSESSTDDDGGVGGDVGIDMRRLLSFSSQAGARRAQPQQAAQDPPAPPAGRPAVPEGSGDEVQRAGDTHTARPPPTPMTTAMRFSDGGLPSLSRFVPLRGHFPPVESLKI